MALNDQVIAYLTINNIVFNVGDYQTGYPEGEADQVLHWDASKLGAQPTTDQLSTAYSTHQANLESARQAKEAAKASVLSKLEALGLTPEDLKSILG
jgi:hypothetical protein